MKRVVITGMGALTPIGNTLEEFWKGLLAGKSGAGPITHFDVSKFKTQFACELKDFNAADHLDRKEIKVYDLFAQYALVAVQEAVQNGNINFESLDRNKIGVIWGSGNGGIATFEQQVMEYANGDGTPRFNPYVIPKIIADIASGAISIKYGLRGLNYTTISACATSTTAIIDSFNYIRWGKANMIITGGSEAPITHTAIGGFGSAKALSTRNDDPASASRPFDVDRDGFVMGEGAGALVLEEYEHAITRGATIYAEVVGGGMAADAYHLTGTHPEGEGAYLGMIDALEDANLKPEDIDYINMHATSTPVGDPSELKAIERVFGHLSKIDVSATKSMTGHLLGAAGAVEAIACVMACRENTIPPTINTKNVDEGIDSKFDLNLGRPKQKQIKYAMSNTFGFGGHIATAIVKKFES